MNIIQKALFFIEENLMLELLLETISDELHYSKYHLSREFNAKVGQPM